jgi:hypothetical protein
MGIVSELLVVHMQLLELYSHLIYSLLWVMRTCDISLGKKARLLTIIENSNWRLKKNI